MELPIKKEVYRGAGSKSSRLAKSAAVRLAERQKATRTRFLLALRELDDAWVAAFPETGFSDVYFSRLFTELWLRADTAVTKTDAYKLVTGLSMQTAMKYVRRAIDQGYLQEFANPADGRSRLLRMSPLLRERFAQVIDRANKAFSAVLGKR
jgi:hypothetical protein